MWNPRAIALPLLIAAATCTTARGNEEEVRAALKAYSEAFNSRDMSKIVPAWAENATHVDRETGERTEGREKIQADIAAAFEASPSLLFEGRVDHVRMIKPDVASVDGETTFTAGDEPPIVTTFSAILVNQDGKWLIDSIEETLVPAAPTSTDALRELEWMVGSWVDEGEDARIEATVRWTPSEAFLLRSFTVDTPDGTLEGTQVIGWDPRSQQIRSWSFNSDGSFGDGVWSRSGDEWLIKSSQTLADGGAASGTYVLKMVDADTIEMELIGHEIDGEPQPAKPAVKVVRKPESASEAPKVDVPAPATGGAK
jgi:uncharacterized protein (TIGR02246 family)